MSAYERIRSLHGVNRTLALIVVLSVPFALPMGCQSLDGNAFRQIGATESEQSAEAPPKSHKVASTIRQAADETAEEQPAPVPVPPGPEPTPSAEGEPAVPHTIVPNYGASYYAGDCPIYGVYCDDCGPCRELDWDFSRPIPWQVFAQGEYIGPARLPHVNEYRIRVDDVIDFVYRLSRVEQAHPYRLEVGDTLSVESLTAESLNREVLIQPDGTITLRQLGQVRAAGRTVDELRKELDKLYVDLVQNPTITVTPLQFNSKLEELRQSVDSRFGSGGQRQQTRVTPEGSIQLPGIGSVPAQGLTLPELKYEVERRYTTEVTEGVDVTPVLTARAPRYVYVVGEVAVPGRFTLEGPTTVMQAVAMAGSWNIGAKLDHIVILRRDENWRLMATRVDLFDAFFGKDPCPAGDLWLRDNDIIVVPKTHLQWTGDLIELLFTRTIYGILPFGSSMSVNFAKLSTI